MAYSQLLLPLLLVPVIAGLFIFSLRWAGSVPRQLITLIHLTSIGLVLGLSVLVVNGVLVESSLIAFHHWLSIDSLGTLFLVLVSGVGFLTGFYAIGYMGHRLESGEIGQKNLCDFYGFFNLFLATMILVIIADNIILMWVAVEATTIASTLLICLYGKRSSLEAAWKYIIICSVGLAFGLYGTILIFSNASTLIANPEHATSWAMLVQNAGAFDPTLTTIAFVFILIGFGTKAGLFPMHTWLPDAYSEAPAPVSALLSSALSNCAFLVIIRYYMISVKALGPSLPQTMLLGFGITSIACGALFIIVQRDIKRLLAYSSIENMGIVALALGIGGPLAIFAGLLHALNNSLAKAMAFCVSGNIEIKYGTSDSQSVKGVMSVMPASGVFFGISVLALAGLPPFNVFVSEFLVLSSGINAGKPWLSIVVMLLLATVFAGIVRMVTNVLLGEAPQTLQKKESGLIKLAPMAAFVIVILWMGIRVPQPVVTLVRNAAEIVLDKPGTAWDESLLTPWKIISDDSGQTAFSQNPSSAVPPITADR
ncbi:MAG: hydrogenase 4 subunit F [Burkholderiaceae bacterium]|jgi:hydrogenase-4 component F|nr:hydrogenase 4 subunit F [Burkholderiaceae bacterium]